MAVKSLDQKLARIHADPSCRDFILADAKDADMAFGLSAPGLSPEHHSGEARFRTLDEYRQQIRDIVAQGLVDIMLMSSSTSECLTIRERIFDGTAVTPAVRANDTTDIWLAAGSGRYSQQPSLPFRTTTIDHAQCGKAQCADDERHLGVDLGLYSCTFNNDAVDDLRTLEAYKAFRLEAEAKGSRHCWEVFSPNAPAVAPPSVPDFVNDHIARALAGVTSAGRPIFLKIPYFGPAAMEALARYDRSLVVGILGGSAGTTFDAMHMLWEAKRYGARVALYGRKINNAEDQLTFVHFLRLVADDQISPEEAVRAYHGALQRLGIRPKRPLADDLQQTAVSHAYSTGSRRAGRSVAAARPDSRKTTSGQRPTAASRTEQDPDFARMTPAEKARWNLERWKRIIG